MVPADIVEPLCAWLSEGRTLRDFCRQPGMPSRDTLEAWRRKHGEFAHRVARARDIGFDAIADQCATIADDEDKPGEDAQRSKLRVETRLKLLACWDPRRYGNKVQVGGDGGEPIKVAIDKDRAEKELASILANAANRVSEPDGS